MPPTKTSAGESPSHVQRPGFWLILCCMAKEPKICFICFVQLIVSRWKFNETVKEETSFNFASLLLRKVYKLKLKIMC
jgi:hypothetical protein